MYSQKNKNISHWFI